MQDESQIESAQKSPADDVDVKSPTGMGMKIVVATVVIALILGGIAAAYFFFIKPESERKQKIAQQEDFMSEYTRLRSTGYDDFWKCVFPLATEEQANSNLKLVSIINNAISQNEERFGKHIAGCLEILKKHVNGAKELKALPEYEQQVRQLPSVLDAVYDSWKTLSDEYSKAGERANWDKRLDDATTRGWGQMYVDYQKRKKPADETMRNARRYMKFVTCAVGKTYKEMGNSVEEVQESLVKIMLDGKCSTEDKAIDEVNRIESECVKYLTSPDPPPPDDDWDHVIKRGIFFEIRSLAVIAGSWERRTGCMRIARQAKAKIMIQNLFNAWVAYKKVAKGVEDIYIRKMKDLKKK